MEPRDPWRFARCVVLHAAGAFLLDLSSGFFVMQTGVAFCYPPAGLYLAAILRLGSRALPLVLLNPLFPLPATVSNRQIPWPAALSISTASMIPPALVLAFSTRARFRQGDLESFSGGGLTLAACLAAGVESMAGMTGGAGVPTPQPAASSGRTGPEV